MNSIWYVLATLLLLVANVADAQSTPADHSSYVEINRPKMTLRKLSGDEARAMQKALAAVKKMPTEVNLLALKPFAESGDANAIRAMMSGYNRLILKVTGEKPENVQAGYKLNPVWPRHIPISAGRLEDRYVALAGLWAMVLYRQNLPADGEAGSTLKQCMATTGFYETYDYWRTELKFTGRRKKFDCGFDTYTPFGQYVIAGQKSKPVKGSPSPFRFVERPVTSQSELDRQRWDRTMHFLGGPRTVETEHFHDLIDPTDFSWARGYAYALPENYPQWIAMQFNHDLQQARAKQTELVPGTDVWLYMKADPAREKAYQDHLSAFLGDQMMRTARLQDAMAGKTTMSRTEMVQAALSAGGDVAAQYWKRYGASPEIGAFAFTFCNVGAESACAQAQQEAAVRAAPTAYSGGLYSQADLDAQFAAFKAREAAINQGNCARASLGASIICNR